MAENVQPHMDVHGLQGGIARFCPIWTPHHGVGETGPGDIRFLSQLIINNPSSSDSVREIQTIEKGGEMNLELQI